MLVNVTLYYMCVIYVIMINPFSGPFVAQNDPNGRVTLLGVLSWGLGCSEKINPGVYSDVRRILAWIEKRMGKQDCC